MLPGHEPADGRQPLLGTGSHESGRRQAPRHARRRRSPRCLLQEARAIHEEDRAMCRAIGEHGAKLLADGQGVLTHCNAGGLATAEYGTALAVFFMAAEQGKRLVRLCRRDPAALARRAAHRLGAAQCRSGRDADLRLDGRPGHARGPRAGGGHGRRPHRRQRRHGQQDRHLRGGRLGRRPQDSLLHRRADEHVRSLHRQRRRRSPSNSATPARSRTVSAGRPRRRA